MNPLVFQDMQNGKLYRVGEKPVAILNGERVDYDSLTWEEKCNPFLKVGFLPVFEELDRGQLVKESID